MVRPDGLFALRAHPFGAALWAFSAAAALCSRLRRSSSASLRTAAAEAATSYPARRRVVEPLTPWFEEAHSERVESQYNQSFTNLQLCYEFSTYQLISHFTDAY